jgi:hypothetical protein
VDTPGLSDPELNMEKWANILKTWRESNKDTKINNVILVHDCHNPRIKTSNLVALW